MTTRPSAPSAATDDIRREAHRAHAATIRAQLAYAGALEAFASRYAWGVFVPREVIDDLRSDARSRHLTARELRRRARRQIHPVSG